MENKFQSQPKKNQKKIQTRKNSVFGHFSRSVLDSKLRFEEHYKMVLSKATRIIGVLCKLHNFLPREEF